MTMILRSLRSKRLLFRRCHIWRIFPRNSYNYEMVVRYSFTCSITFVRRWIFPSTLRAIRHLKSSSLAEDNSLTTDDMSIHLMIGIVTPNDWALPFLFGPWDSIGSTPSLGPWWVSLVEVVVTSRRCLFHKQWHWYKMRVHHVTPFGSLLHWRWPTHLEYWSSKQW